MLSRLSKQASASQGEVGKEQGKKIIMMIIIKRRITKEKIKQNQEIRTKGGGRGGSISKIRVYGSELSYFPSSRVAPKLKFKEPFEA